MRRRMGALLMGLVASLLLASTALAGDCTNASKKNPAAGAQVMVNFVTGDVTWLNPGVVTRVDQGLIDPVSGQGYHGLVAFDADGDGVADLSTWIGVGPDGNELPWQAQIGGQPCRGVTNIGIYYTLCF